jgi:hypothetical protein
MSKVETIYGLRFNGGKLAMHKYQIVSREEDGRIELGTEDHTKLNIHRNYMINEAQLGLLVEHENAYMVFLKDTVDTVKAANTIADRIAEDKHAYLEAVAVREGEFDTQIAMVNDADITALIAGVDG